MNLSLYKLRSDRISLEDLVWTNKRLQELYSSNLVSLGSHKSIRRLQRIFLRMGRANKFSTNKNKYIRRKNWKN